MRTVESFGTSRNESTANCANQKYGLGYFTNEFDFNNNEFVDNELALGQFMTSSQNDLPYENGWLRMDMFKVFQKYLPKTVIE